MESSGRILVIAATPGELASAEGWLSVACGVGPVEAAAATSEVIVRHRPAVVLHVGIAGARRAAALAPATIVVGESSCYADADASARWAPRVLRPSPLLLSIVTRVLPSALVVGIGTTARVGGTLGSDIAGPDHGGAGADCIVEAMEGFAVLRAAERLGVPAIEVRAISNDIEETDRGRWHFAAALEAIKACTPALVRALMDSEAVREPTHG